MSEELAFRSLTEVARAIGAHELTSREVTQAILDRIARLDPVLLSYVTVLAEAALETADRLDKETAAGLSRGPLHGVPIAAKDLIDLAGTPTTAGMPIRRDAIASTDATVMARLRAGGAVILGKLQLTEGAFGVHHPSIPAPINPWNAAYWSGVSSSGSGVATAAGLCYASLGSDTGGSIRYPSTQNGLAGLKPTWGRVSVAGVAPLAPSLDHVGPMARNALDVAALLSVIAGPDPADATASPVPVPDYVAAAEEGIRGRTFGVVDDLGDVDADVARTYEAAVEGLRRAGGIPVAAVLPSNFDQAGRDWVSLCSVETALAHEGSYPERRSDYGPALAGLLETGRGMSAIDYARLQRRRSEIAGELAGLLASVELLLLPVMPVGALSLEYFRTTPRTPEAVAWRIRFAAPFDLSGQPTLTLRGGTNADGVPVGFQIVGRAFDEAGVLAAGDAFQQETDWHLQHPTL